MFQLKSLWNIQCAVGRTRMWGLGEGGLLSRAGGTSQSLVAPGELVEKLLVEGFALLAASRGHEDVAADVLVHNLAVGCHAAERNVHVPVKLDGHLLYVPVDVPLPHVVVAPGLHHITHAQVDADLAVVGDAQDLIFPASLEPYHKVRQPKIW
uniref:Uncharacterized protein n=1 Tax=Anguilla anguilla TaxID=7936 RepID=A0A0E9XJ93_ANGAN